MKTHCKFGHELTLDNRTAAGSCKSCSHKRTRDWKAAHPEAFRQHQRNWDEKHKEKLNEDSKRYRKENPVAVSNTKLKMRYGITYEDRDNMLAAQDGKCRICKIELDGSSKNTKPHVDHVHDETKRVRGILCHGCNMILAYAHDNTDTLYNAIGYLKMRW